MRERWKRGLAVLVAGGFALAPGGARALSIGLAPASAVPTGGSISLDLVVSGLVGGAPPSLGGFEVDLGWDPARLALAQVDFGTRLGDPAAFEAVADPMTSPGFANLAEVSLLAPAALDALQPEAFVLASLRFAVVSPGAAAIDVLRADAADAFGRPLAVEATPGAVVGAVPEPRAAALFALGAALAAGGAGRRGQR